MKLLLAYFKHNWFIYSLLFVYGIVLVINAMGWPLWLPSCLITHITGHQCFGCGINRAAIALISGNIKVAAIYNPLIFIYLPLVFGWISHDIYKHTFKPKQNYYEKYG